MANTHTEIREAVEWLVRDARYLARSARSYRARGRPADIWLADMTRANATHSLNLARRYKAGLVA